MGQDCKNVALDLEVGLVGAEPVEELRKTDTSQPSRGWRIYLALLAIGLCAAAAIFFSVHNLKQHNAAEGSEDLRHTLRQISQHHTIQTAIHLEGMYTPGSGLEWSDDQDQAFTEGDIKLDNNEIVIPRKGLYFVYSQVSFALNCHVGEDSGEPLEAIHLEHQIKRKSSLFEDDRRLLYAMRSGCERVKGEDNGKRWYTTINLGAVFSLNKGDRLFTKTAPLDHIDDESGQTFFGVFAL